MKSRSLVIGALILALLALGGSSHPVYAKAVVLEVNSGPEGDSPVGSGTLGDIRPNMGDPDDILGGDGVGADGQTKPIKDQDGLGGSLNGTSVWDRIVAMALRLSMQWGF